MGKSLNSLHSPILPYFKNINERYYSHFVSRPKMEGEIFMSDISFALALVTRKVEPTM
jgi:hypothetical protein